MTISEIKNKIVELVKENFSSQFDVSSPQINLSFPPKITLGDFAVECFSLAKIAGQSPAQISSSIAPLISADFIEKTAAAGPYINIKIKNNILFSSITSEILDNTKFGQNSELANERIMVEYLSPNTNKPLHLGHLRNGALGMAVSRILEANGATVVKANLVNDRGIHICKSMLAWQKWGNGETPESTGMKGDHFVGKWYIRYAEELEKNPGLENEAKEMLLKWEANDSDIRALWEKMNSWVFQGFNDTFKKLHFQFDKTYLESNTYLLGKALVENGVNQGIFKKEDNGAVTATLPSEEFGFEKDGVLKKATLIRNDGTSVYITQDLETAKLKFDENNLTESIYVVGSEQDYHFKVLFKLLEMLGFSWAKKCLHLSYGMVYLPEGKMKSREGKIVDADDLVDEMRELATKEIEKRDTDNNLPAEEMSMRAAKVADAAIKYYLLQYSPRLDIHFDPQASLSFEGNTGPYCQYTYARAMSILEKAGTVQLENINFSLIGNEEELILANRLISFPDEIILAAKELNPAKIVNATYEIAKSFNQFYQKHSVINAENEEIKKARLVLTKTTAEVIKKGLYLLNIEVLEKM